MRHIGDLDFQDGGRLFRNGVDFHFGVDSVATDDDLDVGSADNGDVAVTLNDYKINSFRADVSEWRKYDDNEETDQLNKHSEEFKELTWAESGQIFTNELNLIDGGFILPKALSGVCYTFTVYTEFYIIVQCQMEDNIQGYGFIKSDTSPMTSVTLRAITENTWVVVQKSGNWTFHEFDDVTTTTYNTALFAGGSNNILIEKVNMLSTGDGIEFGNLTHGTQYAPMASNSIYQNGLIFDGWSDSQPNKWIQALNLATGGDAVFFGYTNDTHWLGTSVDNGQLNRAVIAANYNGYQNYMEYITISSFSDGIDFGDLTQIRSHIGQSTSNHINDRGVISGGYYGAPGVNVIDYITISTPSNAIDFGDLNYQDYGSACTSNGTLNRGLILGRNNNTYCCQYITINSLGNATEFPENLLFGVAYTGATSNKIGNRAVVASTGASVFWINISTLSDTDTFGSLAVSRSWRSALTNS